MLPLLIFLATLCNPSPQCVTEEEEARPGAGPASLRLTTNTPANPASTNSFLLLHFSAHNYIVREASQKKCNFFRCQRGWVQRGIFWEQKSSLCATFSNVQIFHLYEKYTAIDARIIFLLSIFVELFNILKTIFFSNTVVIVF